MALYRFFIFRDGEVVGQSDGHCADDLAALRLAGVFPLCEAVEVYVGARFVARVTPGRESESVDAEDGHRQEQRNG